MGTITVIVWGRKVCKKKKVFYPTALRNLSLNTCHQAFECEHIQEHLNVQH